MNDATTLFPAGSLVLLIGQAGSGKSRLAAALFPPSSVLSSDAFRAMCSSPGDQTANRAAWQALGVVLGERLRRGLLTVVDATNSFGPDRADLIGGARSHGRPVVALVADVDLGVSLARNAVRPDDRRVPEDVLADQHAQVAAALSTLHTEVDQVLYASRLPVLELALRRMDADSADHRDKAEVLRTFGPAAAALFDWTTDDVDGIRTGVFAAGGTHQVVRWVDTGDPSDARFEARVACQATPDCPGPAWTLVWDLDTLAAAHAGQPEDGGVRCDRTHYTADVVAVDEDGRVLLIERRWPPFKGLLALPGGHVDPGDADSRDAGARELAEETGVKVPADALTLIGTYDAPGRDPRGRYSTDAYLARVPAGTVAAAADDAASVQWVEPSAALAHGLAFDHADILRAAIR